MTANPVKPSRYRAGKATRQESSSESDASDAEEPTEAPVPPPPKATSAGKLTSNLQKVDLNARRREAEDTERRRIAAQQAEQTAVEEGFVTEGESDGDEDAASGADSDGESESDEEEEESSEEEAPRRLMMRPKFVPKSKRGAATDTQDQEEENRLAEEAARKQATDEMVEEQIKRDLAAKAVGKKHWDDQENEDSDVDTTDGLDPEAEEAAWKVRELKRMKRARTAIEEREKELAEVERRRNLTEEERQAEDNAHLAKQKDEKDSRGKMSYMQKYFHKGAFFQEETEAAGLLERDIMGSRIQDDVRNREALPEYLQRRDMTKLGRKGASKYKDMRAEDTGRWGNLDDGRRKPDSRFVADDRFQADDDRFRPDERGARGANTVPLGERRERKEERKEERTRDSEKPHDRDSGRGGDGYRTQERRRDRDDNGRPRQGSYSRSRSRSPRRDHADQRRRKRSTSRQEDHHDGDKRRRVDAR